MKVGVAGASGYAGAELLRLCASHPQLEVAVATAGARAGEPVGGHTPSLAAAYPSLVYARTEPVAFDGLDLVFCALPHGESQRLVPQILAGTGAIVDLAADFRLQDPSLYPAWYGGPHGAPDLLPSFAYGLPELYRSAIMGSRRVAVPGCYPTAAALALAPLVRAGVVDTARPVIVDAASGVSGAGRSVRDGLHFAHADGGFSAYGLLSHRHTPEMEQVLGASVLFTPHLAPMTRGILATCYASSAESLSSNDALALLREAYAGEPFVVVTEDPPSTKATLASNCAHVTARVDERMGMIVGLTALDNLVKGAAGQAVQCANLVLDLDEAAGLPMVAVYP